MFTKCCRSNQRSGFSYVERFFNFSHRRKSLVPLYPLACRWNNRTCKLFLHYEHGFTLYSDPTDSVTNGGSATSTGNVRLLWQQPFEKLRSSADDNEHLLTLDFHGEEGVVVWRDLTLFWFYWEELWLCRNWTLAHLQNPLSSIYTRFCRLKQHGLVLLDELLFQYLISIFSF